MNDPPRTRTTEEHRHVALASLGVALAAVVLYLPTLLSADFVDLDDGQYVLQNPLVLEPSLANAATFLREVRHPSTVAGYYQPLTMISLMADARLAGARGLAIVPPAPTLFHLTSILLHALNSVLVLLIVRAACGGLFAPIIVALVFAWHPLQVESVSWISQRKTVLSGAFALAGVLAHMRFAASGRATWQWVTLIVYVFALLAKPTVLPLPLLLLLFDVWPLRRFGRRAIVEKWPLLIVMIGGAWVSVTSQTETVGVVWPRAHMAMALAMMTSHNLWLYIVHGLWPVRLSFIYPLPASVDWAYAPAATALIGTILLTAVWISSWRWSRPLFVGLAGGLLMLGAGLAPVRFYQSCVGDRFAYLAITAVLLPVAVGLTSLCRWPAAGGRRLVVLLASALVLLPLARASLAQQEHWRDAEALWLNAVQHAPGNAIANAALADALLRRTEIMLAAQGSAAGDSQFRAQVRDLLNDALRRSTRAIAAEPNKAPSRLTHGAILLRLGRPRDAIDEFEHALRVGAGPLTAQAQVLLGKAHAATGDVARACDAFDAALRDRPRDLNMALRLQMGQALADARRADLAVRFFAAATQVAPDDPQAHMAVGAAAGAAGDWSRAARAFERARELFAGEHAEVPENDLNLARAWLELGRADEAAVLFSRPAVRAEMPDESTLGLAGAAALKGNKDEAFRLLCAVLGTRPEFRAIVMRRKCFETLRADPRWRDMFPGPANSPASAPR